MNEKIIAALNELLAAESGCLAARLIETDAFVTADSTEAYVCLEAIAAENKRHCEQLVEAILASGSAPAPAIPSARFGDLHFIEVPRALPHVTTYLENAIQVADRIHDAIVRDSHAAVLTKQIAAAHRKQVARLDDIMSVPAA